MTCGHRTNKANRICKSCLPAYVAGVLPLHDGTIEPWRKHRHVYVPRTNKCIDCGMPIGRRSTRCAKHSAARLAKIGNKAKAERCVERDKAICADIANGAPTATVAAKYKLSVSRIRAICKKVGV